MDKNEEQPKTSSPTESLDPTPGPTIIFKTENFTPVSDNIVGLYQQLNSTGTIIQGTIDGLNQYLRQLLSLDYLTASTSSSSSSVKSANQTVKPFLSTHSTMYQEFLPGEPGAM